MQLDALFEKTINSFKTEVVKLYERRSIVPCLMLLYSFIDILAWLLYEEKTKEVGERYRKFVDEYFLPESELSCSADDIYSARCGILHSYSSESNKTERGKAKRIYYIASDKEGDSSESVIPEPTEDVIQLKIEDMISAFENSIEKLLDHMRNDPYLEIEIEERSRDWLVTW